MCFDWQLAWAYTPPVAEKRLPGQNRSRGGSRLRLAALAVVALVLVNLVIPRPPKPTIQLSAELVPILGLRVSNSMLATWLAMLTLIGVSFRATRRMKLVPGRLQNAAEWAIEALLNTAQRITGTATPAVFPVVATLFLFILTANWMELLPGFGSVGIVPHEGDGELIPLLRSAVTDLNTTIALALVAVGSIQVIGLRRLGLGYLRRYVDPNNLRGPGSVMERIARVFVGLLEIFDQLTKILSFSFRLFGNIFAGEVLLFVIGFLLPVIGPLPFMGLEIFVGFIQALIFALLTLVFTASALGESSEES